MILVEKKYHKKALGFNIQLKIYFFWLKLKFFSENLGIGPDDGNSLSAYNEHKN